MVGAPDARTVDPIITRLAEKDHVPWYKKPNLRSLYFLLVPVCLGVEWTSGFDSSMMNGIQTVGTWKTSFDYPDKAKLGFMSASYSLGCILALPFVPIVGDNFGRKNSIMCGSVIMIIGTVIQAAAQNFPMFIIGRILLGMGIPFAIVAASALIGELSYPKERATLTSLFNASWFIGAIAAAGATLGTFDMPNTWAWRIPSLLQLVPTFFQLAFIWWLPESPRFLISKDRHEEALAILTKYHAEGDVNSEFVKAEFAQIQAAITLEQENKRMTWGQYFTTAANHRRAVIALCVGVFTQWSGNNPLSFYLSKILNQVGITSPRQQNVFNLGNTCWGFCNAVFMALMVQRFKRRTMYLTCITGILCVYIMLTVSAAQFAQTGVKSAGTTTLVAIFLYSPLYNMGFNALTYTYLVEIFPFAIRAKGITMQQWWVRAANFINTFVNPIGMDTIGWKYYIWYCCWIAFEACCIFFLFPETSGRTLEELAFLFEGEEANQEMQKRMEKAVDITHAAEDKEEVERVEKV